MACGETSFGGVYLEPRGRSRCAETRPVRVAPERSQHQPFVVAPGVRGAVKGNVRNYGNIRSFPLPVASRSSVCGNFLRHTVPGLCRL